MAKAGEGETCASRGYTGTRNRGDASMDSTASTQPFPGKAREPEAGGP